MDSQFTLPDGPEQKYEEPDLSDLKPGTKRTMTDPEEYAKILEICKRKFERKGNPVIQMKDVIWFDSTTSVYKSKLGWNITFDEEAIETHIDIGQIHSLSFDMLVTLLEKHI